MKSEIKPLDSSTWRSLLPPHGQLQWHVGESLGEWVQERVGGQELYTADRDNSSEELCWKGGQKIGAVLGGGYVFWFP